MALALGTAAVVLIVLLWELTRPVLKRFLARQAQLWSQRSAGAGSARYDPGRERRAEQRARALLRSCIEEADWSMYRDLGFLRVWGALGEREGEGEREREGGGGTAQPERGPGSGASYAYLIYPHKPIVAYLPATGELLNEYCVAFPDHTRPYGSARLPDSDDVLAKWMALTADERTLVGEANMHLPGRQVDPDRVRRDLARLSAWERERAGEPTGSVRAA
jgi:hypothetical protein